LLFSGRVLILFKNEGDAQHFRFANDRSVIGGNQLKLTSVSSIFSFSFLFFSDFILFWDSMFGPTSMLIYFENLVITAGHEQARNQRYPTKFQKARNVL